MAAATVAAAVEVTEAVEAAATVVVAEMMAAVAAATTAAVPKRLPSIMRGSAAQSMQISNIPIWQLNVVWKVAPLSQ